MTEHAEVRRLLLRIERALLAKRQLRSLLTEADVALATQRRELRNLQARVARAAAMMQRHPGKGRHSSDNARAAQAHTDSAQVPHRIQRLDEITVGGLRMRSVGMLAKTVFSSRAMASASTCFCLANSRAPSRKSR